MSVDSAVHAYLQLAPARKRVEGAAERRDAAMALHQAVHSGTALDVRDPVLMARRAAAEDTLARALEDYQQALRSALGTYSLMPLRPPF